VFAAPVTEKYNYMNAVIGVWLAKVPSLPWWLHCVEAFKLSNCNCPSSNPAAAIAVTT
jgi:hypothetical protein